MRPTHVIAKSVARRITTTRVANHWLWNSISGNKSKSSTKAR
jgi:hypothetical protein